MFNGAAAYVLITKQKERGLMKKQTNLDKQHRYPWPVIETAVQLHLAHDLPYRAVSEKMSELGVEVSHKTVFEWVQKFSDNVAAKGRRRGGSYSIEETFVKCNGELMYMYRAHDQKNVTLGVFLRARKNSVSAKSFFKKMLDSAAAN